MDQVSRPLLIALGATVALVAIWLVALQPKPVGIEHTPLAPTKEIAKARQAVGISDAASAKAAGADAAQAAPAQPAATPTQSARPANGATANSTTPPATASRKAAHAAVPTQARHARETRRDAAVMRLVAHGKIVVMLFWNAKSADDVATRGALRDLNLHRGKVVVRLVPIGDVARYPSVTRRVKIGQSPTTVVIGRKGRTRVLAGLSDPREISNAVRDALAGR